MTNTQTPPPATTVVIPTGAPATNIVANHAEKPEKFNGQNFKRWQQKMFFYLTTLGLARFLKETVPQILCRTWYLQDYDCLKMLWESLKRKYKTEDRWFLLHDIHVLREMTLIETFQEAAIIEKLPSKLVGCSAFLVIIASSNSKGKRQRQKKNDKKTKEVEYLAPKAGLQKFVYGNSATADIKGEGDVVLKMTSKKELKLTNVENEPTSSRETVTSSEGNNGEKPSKVEIAAILQNRNVVSRGFTSPVLTTKRAIKGTSRKDEARWHH
ncbi:hypothetical protein Tco_0721545 [Tanacetum coccineum]